jgi:hypothetical protein
LRLIGGDDMRPSDVPPEPLLLEVERVKHLERCLTSLSNGPKSPLRDSLLNRITSELNCSLPSIQDLALEVQGLQETIKRKDDELRRQAQDFEHQRSRWEEDLSSKVETRVFNSPKVMGGKMVRILLIIIILLQLYRQFHGAS